MALVTEELGEATFERAAALVAREHAAARQVRPELSRPFWLNAGFRPTGYGLFRLIEPRR